MTSHLYTEVKALMNPKLSKYYRLVGDVTDEIRAIFDHDYASTGHIDTLATLTTVVQCLLFLPHYITLSPIDREKFWQLAYRLSSAYKEDRFSVSDALYKHPSSGAVIHLKGNTPTVVGIIDRHSSKLRNIEPAEECLIDIGDIEKDAAVIRTYDRVHLDGDLDSAIDDLIDTFDELIFALDTMISPPKHRDHSDVRGSQSAPSRLRV